MAKPSVAFPEPSSSSFTREIDGTRVRFIDLPALISLKLTSYLSSETTRFACFLSEFSRKFAVPEDRAKDRVDVEELIRANSLDNAFAQKLDSSVRDEFQRLVKVVQRRISKDNADRE